MNKSMSEHLRHTEDRLQAEIRRIGGLLARATTRGDQRARCAASYLNQLLRDREDTLATVQAQRRQPT
jgi:hypothetical protein